MPDNYLSPSLSLNSPIPEGSPRIRWPFWSEGDTTTIIIEQDYLWTFEKYKPLALNSPISLSDLNAIGSSYPANASACIYLEDTEPQIDNAGLCIFTRKWGTVPIERSKPISASVNYFGQAYRQASYTTYFSGSTVSNSPVVGEKVYGIFNLTTRTSSWVISLSSTVRARKAEIVQVSPSVVIGGDNGFVPSYKRGTLTFIGWTTGRLPAKGPRTRFTACRIIKSYVVGLDQATFNANEALQIITDAGAQTDTISETTSPTQTEWRNMINGNDFFIAQDTEVSRYMGDVYELSTLYAPAKW